MVEHEGSSDLLIGTLKNDPGHGHAHGDGYDHDHADHHRSDATAAAPTEQVESKAQSRLPRNLDGLRDKLVNSPLLAGFGLALGVLVGSLVRGRAGLMLGFLGLVAVLGAGVAWAGPGHDRGEGSASLTQGDAPRWLADGKVIRPKPSQRQLAIRTRVLAAETTRSADRLIGRVNPDPNRSGLVQSTIGGHIVIAPEGLPALGQRVKKGQVLAYVQPAFAPIDSSDVRQTAGDLAQRIAVLDARIARQKRLVNSGVVNAASLEDLEIERGGLDARRQQLAKSRSEPEAPVGRSRALQQQATLLQFRSTSPMKRSTSAARSRC